MFHRSAKQARGNKKLRIHLDLSDLIYYSRSVRFQSFADSEKEEYYNMSSFNEKKALSFVKQNGGQPMVCFSPLPRQRCRFSFVRPFGLLSSRYFRAFNCITLPLSTS